MRRAPVDPKKFIPGRPGDHRFVHPLSVGFSHKNAISGYDWRKPNTYKYPGSAKYKSWLAWEALRRNVLFQRYCNDNDPNNDRNWSDEPKPYQWGLVKFKHYAQPIVKTDPATWPDWTPSRSANLIDFVSPYEARRPGSKKPTIHTPSPKERRMYPLKGGQVAVVFDLEQTKYFKSLLFHQVDETKRNLRAIVNALQVDPKSPRVVERPQEESVIALLRVADAMLETPRPSTAEIAAVVFPGGRKLGKTPSSKGRLTLPVEPDNMWLKVRSAASLIYRQGYLSLLLSDRE